MSELPRNERWAFLCWVCTVGEVHLSNEEWNLPAVEVEDILMNRYPEQLAMFRTLNRLMGFDYAKLNDDLIHYFTTRGMY